MERSVVRSTQAMFYELNWCEPPTRGLSCIIGIKTRRGHESAATLSAKDAISSMVLKVVGRLEI